MASEGQSEREIKVDDTTIKVKTPPSSKLRPEYNCEQCSKSFPSELDLMEHKKLTTPKVQAYLHNVHV